MAYTRIELALKLKPIIAERAKERQAEYHGNQHDKKSGLVAELPQVQKDAGKTRDVLADKANVSPRTFAKVEAIKASPHFTPETEVGSGAKQKKSGVIDECFDVSTVHHHVRHHSPATTAQAIEGDAILTDADIFSRPAKDFHADETP